MNKDKIWLSSPHMGGSEQQYIYRAFKENWIAPLGPNVTGFEQDIKDYLKEDVFIAAVSSGTAALHLALLMAGVKAGDEVLCQSMTFVASANPINYVGATPIFIDSEKETLNISPQYLKKAVQKRMEKGKKPKAIIAVHLYGMPYKVKEIHAIAREYDIPIIEDSAEALGSSYEGQKCGTFGDFAIFSFNGNKIITTSGGGALITKNQKLKEKAIFLATQARDDAPYYQHSEIGYNYRMSNVSAGIGRGQMEVLDAHVNLRRKNNKFYRNLFKEVEEVKVFCEPEKQYFCNHWLTVITIDSNNNMEWTSERLREHLLEYNIESRPLWKPMHLQPVFASSPFYGSTVAEDAFKSGLCLPSGSNLSDEDKERIGAAVKSFFNI
ncbi:DegT/DnrJ/EryC1/StrS family aminotransferase [Salinimicrobium sp. GXAS 041]|uniref:DegT/DnrJ/EryC1/StrS family aminotransferase n=1 Tax=Salinimicrobium sp. GXAS 041 TaxID=3400806 RepID=UPI003C7617F3